MDACNSFQIDSYVTNLSLMSLIVKRFSVCLYGIKWVIPLSYNAHIHALNRCGAWLCRKGAALKTRRGRGRSPDANEGCSERNSPLI